MVAKYYPRSGKFRIRTKIPIQLVSCFDLLYNVFFKYHKMLIKIRLYIIIKEVLKHHNISIQYINKWFTCIICYSYYIYSFNVKNKQVLIKNENMSICHWDHSKTYSWGIFFVYISLYLQEIFEMVTLLFFAKLFPKNLNMLIGSLWILIVGKEESSWISSVCFSLNCIVLN